MSRLIMKNTKKTYEDYNEDYNKVINNKEKDDKK